MTTVIISGQNHRGSTYHIARQLADKIAQPNEIQEIFLPADMPHFCCGCTQCFMLGAEKCPHYQQIKPLTEKMDEADVLIFASPVYVYHVTGSMKAFLDHYGYRWMVHRPEERMFRKQAVVISTAAGGGMKSTCRDLEDSCFFWGVAKTYRCGVAVMATSWNQVTQKKRAAIQMKTDRLAKQLKSRVGRVKPGIKTRVFFYIMHLAQRKGISETDAAYWKDKGWTGKKRPWKTATQDKD